MESITHQSISRRAAATIFERVEALSRNGHVPSPEQILRFQTATLRKAGLFGAKVRAVKDLARKTLVGVVPTLEQARAMSDDELVERLSSVGGIGALSVEMFLIFRLGVRTFFRSTILVSGTGAPSHTARTTCPRPTSFFGESWRLYRAVATWYMWRALQRAGYAATNKIRPAKIRRRRKWRCTFHRIATGRPPPINYRGLLLYTSNR